jgi:hypothetical protein
MITRVWCLFEHNPRDHQTDPGQAKPGLDPVRARIARGVGPAVLQRVGLAGMPRHGYA